MMLNRVGFILFFYIRWYAERFAQTRRKKKKFQAQPRCLAYERVWVGREHGFR